MSADLAGLRDSTSTAMMTANIFDFRVDCPREIDFDFFDAGPSLFSPAWDTHTRSSQELNDNSTRNHRSPSPTSSTASNEDTDVVVYIPQNQERNDRLKSEIPQHEVNIQSDLTLSSQEQQGQDETLQGIQQVNEHAADFVSSSCSQDDANPQQGTPYKSSGESEERKDSNRDQEPEGRVSLKGGGQIEENQRPVSKENDDCRRQKLASLDPKIRALSSCSIKTDGNEVAPLGVTELFIVPKHPSKARPRQGSATSSMTGISSVPGSGCSSEESSAEDAEAEVGVTILTGALRSLRPPSSTRSYASSTLSKRSHQSNRINMSFSNDEVRRIQRENEILLRRIVAQKARVPARPERPVGAGVVPSGAGFASTGAVPPGARPCSHAINRTRRARDIQRENEILLKKIQSVKRSSSRLAMASRSSSSLSGRA